MRKKQNVFQNRLKRFYIYVENSILVNYLLAGIYGALS